MLAWAKKVHETPTSKEKVGCDGMHLSSQLLWEAQNRRIRVQTSLGIKQTLSPKQKEHKWLEVWLKG
jgi:hypothetical protein